MDKVQPKLLVLAFLPISCHKPSLWNKFLKTSKTPFVLDYNSLFVERLDSARRPLSGSLLKQMKSDKSLCLAPSSAQNTRPARQRRELSSARGSNDKIQRDM